MPDTDLLRSALDRDACAEPVELMASHVASPGPAQVNAVFPIPGTQR